jgi:hypothetical protein
MRVHVVSGTRRNGRSRAAWIVLGVGSALLVLQPAATRAQTPCGAEVREEIVRALDAAANLPAAEREAIESDLYAKYEPCGLGATAPSAFINAARQCGASVSNLGSLFYEEMSCAGYDPQRRQFASPIKIKQTFGFGAAPLPGSRERVLHCVADAAGTLLPVGHDSVHLANALPGNVPTWQFAVVASAHENLHTVYPFNGQTRRARSILSWALTPTDCNYKPIWGNALNYRIRLDQ